MSKSATSGWPMVALGEVVEFLDHKRKPVTKKDRVPGDVPYYGANGIQDYVSDYLFDEDLVLLAEDGGNFFEPEKRVAYGISGKSWVNNHAHVLKPANRIEFRYLSRVLENRDLTRYLSGTTRAKLNKGAAERIEIPLPPLAEQKRIAAILDKADGLSRQRRQALALLDTLTQSIFVEMFGDGSTVPMVELHDLVRTDDRVNYGVVQPGEADTGGVPLIRGTDLAGGVVDHSRLRTVAVDVNKKHSKSILRGDEVLISCVGRIGEIAVATRNEQGFNIARQVTRVPLREDVSSVYVASYLRSETVQNYFRAELRTVAQPTLNVKQIKETLIPVPSLERQQHFTKRVERTVVARMNCSKSLNHLDTLFAFLQSRAFAGDL